ncbi:glycosyl hydrolase family 18 protein [Kineothrix sp. MB12-C1]|uniref:glycosyl hydrolase family 18 protein n=1 Tax=Kineothrix sp. MB12-C1 TaxID=3070215 RepID=UPI0027D2013C|nr:glycosyl hydrolase family 18 protein [Kineothrix sp. MB12-C1]WMC93969.1 glycosyl hydrolase family 18 protein [Kineothrix sp. MB12-C1]
MTIYTVNAGDSVNSIAAAYSISPDSIIYNNQLSSPYQLAVGQALLLSTGESPTEKRTIYTNGYAYPFINEFTLTETLPYLTNLSIFSYGFTTTGELVPPPLDDTWMIALAKEAGTAPILTLTPFGPDGMFNNNLITVVVNNMEIQQNLIDNLLEMVSQKGYEGVDIDFEYILAEDRVPFAEFVANVRTAVNALGYPVSVALAPKTSDDQPGLLYGGKDYGLLGAAADNVLLMTYEWGYTYGPPMAVAPINRVREVVDYAITRIPVDKINLGIPNYGYDWPLPYERGVTGARTISNTEAVQIAIDNNVPIQFDEVAMSPFFTYERDGIAHEVWFEDVRSMREKFNLINEYELRGAGYWQIMNLFRANWLLLADTFNIIKQ